MHKYIKRLKQTNHQVTHPSFTWNHEILCQAKFTCLTIEEKKERKKAEKFSFAPVAKH